MRCPSIYGKYDNTLYTRKLLCWIECIDKRVFFINSKMGSYKLALFLCSQVLNMLKSSNEPPAPSEDSDQPDLTPSLSSLSCVLIW